MGKFHVDYIKTLVGKDLARYKELIHLCCGIDPYEVDVNSCVCDEALIPNVNIVHITSYLIKKTIGMSMEKMCNYHSTDGYKFLIDGWVQSVKFRRLSSSLILCLGEVKHSYSVNLSNNKPWALVKEDGEIIGGWCTCKAGRGESCNHLAALLYALQYGAEKRRNTACTSRACSWLPPRMKDVPYSEVRNIDFTPPDSKRLRMDEEECTSTPPPQPRPVLVSPDDLTSFFRELHLVAPEAAVFRVVPEFCEEYAPKSLDVAVIDVFDKGLCDLSLEELRVKCVSFASKWQVTLEDSLKMEKKTRGQSSSPYWLPVKKGRIGGSTVHSVMTTDINNPSITSVTSICDPLKPRKVTKWMRRGTEMEDKAREDYVKYMEERHVNFKVFSRGAYVPPEFPYLVASIDGLTHCDCCGFGIVEIKCPKNPNEDEEYIPPQYYDQIQHYLLCYGDKSSHADYYVWHEQKQTLKRIPSDKKRQEEIERKCEEFFKKVILVEMASRYYSSLKHLLQDVSLEPSDIPDIVCYCQKPKENPMVKCLGKNCTFEVFHLHCVGLSRQPAKGKWLCMQCKPSSVL